MNNEHIEVIQMDMEDFDHETLPLGSKAYYQLNYDSGMAEQGILPVCVIRGYSKGPRLLVMAAVHGDEYEGILALTELIPLMGPADVQGDLVVIPVVNVSAYYGGTRCSQADGKNLARSFPGDAEGLYTDRLAWHIRNTFIAKADFMLDLHSGGTHYAMPLMVGYDSSRNSRASILSQAAAESIGVEVIWGHESIPPGRTVSAASELSVPWLYMEAYGGQRIRQNELEAFRNAVLHLMNHMHMLSEPIRWVKESATSVSLRLTGDGNLDRSDEANCEGLFVPAVRLLDEVRKGTLIGVIYDWFGCPLQEIIAPSEGIVMMLREVPYTKPGDGLFTLALREKD
ncbi:succinylglutamate desuccinylase/aspartoacylase family protein [Paenibacillus nasutitermitis]|uniref:Succinylglutamate desuccinylase n=1 Tax=Paenibacillus nasutitermitis TaxID=1652958 RepID=A0A916ZJ91_9BACL|nr:succinylglutamate desuccinylase/aspartoacylase family protein [Paenibacillus nasutitermitis]GGD99205.1 succinylglutamate desuccinylase [Paenibacillus nasutitermitis]